MRDIISTELIVSLIIVILGFLIYFLLKCLINKILDKRKYVSKKKKTYLKLFKSIFKYVILIVVVVLVLQVNGINVTSIIAGLGIASVIAGFALQDAIKDIIMGFNIIVDEYYSVGDVVRIGEIEGKVLELGLKSTKMVDINTNDIFVIANREISKSLVVSTQFDIDIPIPYKEKISRVESIIEEIISQVKDLKNITNIEYRGLNKFGESAIYYKIRMYAKAEYQPQLKRDINRIIKLELDKNNIDIPYLQVDIHNK